MKKKPRPTSPSDAARRAANKARRTVEKAIIAAVRADVAEESESIRAAGVPFPLMAARAVARADSFDWDQGSMNKRYGRAVAAEKRAAGLNKDGDRVPIAPNVAGARTAASFEKLEDEGPTED